MPDWYDELLGAVLQRVAAGRVRSVQSANAEMIVTYWGIGKDILDRQQQEGWGAKVIDRLAVDLQRRVPGARGFSPRNLRYMRTFAAEWPDPEIVQQLVAQLPWGHQIMLLQRVRSTDARLWYVTQAAGQGWSRSTLDLQIERQLFERTGRAITNFAKTLPESDSDLARQAIKDPYLLDFFGPSTGMHERHVEQALIDHVEKFLLELGQGFAFVGRQQRLTIGGEDFYLDLLFFHIELNRYVVIELKAVPFQPGFIGQLGTYMVAIDDQIKKPHHAPTLGLILCKTKNDLVAEYALSSSSRPIGVADWTDALQTSLPPEIAEELPSIADLEAELGATDTLVLTEQVEVARADDGGTV